MDIALWAVGPLLSGYIFSVLFPPSASYAAREDGHKLYFRSTFYGIFLFLCSILILSISLRFFPVSTSWVVEFILYLSEPFSNFLKNKNETANLILLNIICLNTAVILGLLSNSNKRFKLLILDNVIKSDDIEVVITRAVRRGKPISLSMQSGKIYVGFVAATIDPKEKRKDIRILPLLSGYRRQDTMQFEFTTNYHKIYEVKDLKLPHLELKDFEIVFPLSEIQSINLFDIRAYNIFRSENPLVQEP